MSNAALIVAAGRGKRAGGEVPKQWRKIAGQPVILRHCFGTSPPARVPRPAATIKAALLIFWFVSSFAFFTQL